MNKNLKRIIALALVFGTVSAVAPATGVNLFTTKAYAEQDDDNTDETLKSLELESSNGSTIKLYGDSDYKSDRLDDNDKPNKGDTYYAKSKYSKVNIKYKWT